MSDNYEETCVYMIVVAFIIVVVVGVSNRAGKPSKKDICIDAGYVYIDKQCLNVEVIEL